MGSSNSNLSKKATHVVDKSMSEKDARFAKKRAILKDILEELNQEMLEKCKGIDINHIFIKVKINRIAASIVMSLDSPILRNSFFPSGHNVYLNGVDIRPCIMRLYAKYSKG